MPDASIYFAACHINDFYIQTKSMWTGSLAANQVLLTTILPAPDLNTLLHYSLMFGLYR